MNLKLDYTGQTGDLDTIGARVKLVEGAESIEQNVKVRLRFFIQSWFLDRAQGLPYYQNVLIKNPNLLSIESDFRETVRTTRGISTVDTFTATIDKETRKLSIGFSATMDTGAPLVFDRFVIGL